MSKKQLKVKNGIAQPLGKGYYLMNGPSHEQGGIDIGKNLEVEGGEIVKLNPKSIKVLSNAKIMGDMTPAEYALGGLEDGTFEDRYNKGFKYQEKFKDINRLNDDGTKAELGIFKKIKESNIGKRIIDHLKYNTFFDNKTYDDNIIPINEQITNGEYELYPIAEYSHYNKGNFYKKGDRIVYDDNQDYNKQPEYMKYKGYEPLSYDELRKMLPKRDYIGGSKRDVGIKVINKVPGLKDEILRLSEVYGISPNVFTQRLVNEGWVQEQAKMYNRTSVKNQKEYRWNRMNDFVDGFNTLGLDTFGNHHKAGHLNLRRDIKYYDKFTTNEDNTGRVYNSAEFDNMYDALEAKAAMIEYLTKLGKNKGHSGSDLDAWVNAAYNMGEYHKDLNNIDYVRKQYGFEPYYKLGGQMKKKYKIGGNVNVPSTGEKIKAKYGTRDKLVTDFLNQTIDEINSTDYSTEFGLPSVSFTTPRLKVNDTSSIVVPDGYYNTKNGAIFKDFENKNTNRLGLTTGDWINAGVNIGGALINLASRHSLPQKAIKYKSPIPLTAIKGKTKININPQLRELDKTINKYTDTINKNTASSQVSLNRLRDLNLNRLDMINKLYGQKENQETALINQDNRNLQNIINQNIQAQNIIDQKNLENEIQTANLNRLERADAITDFVQNIAQTTGNVLSNVEKRKQFDKNLITMGLSYPNLNIDELLKVIGLR